MINPIYKFEMTATYGQTVNTKTVYPAHKADLAIDWQIEQNEQYYRGKLSGKLKFVADDYDFINSKNFETEFELRLFISYNGGASWSQYWTGRFWKTDCEFDADNKIITISPTTYDDYTDVVAGMEKEYNLIELAPAMNVIKVDKRPMIQVYSPGESVVACFLSGMYWEQDATAVTDESALTSQYHFSLLASIRKVRILRQSGTISPDVTGLYYGAMGTDYQNYLYANDTYSFQHTYTVHPNYVVKRWSVIRNADNVELWAYEYSGNNPPVGDLILTLSPIAGTGATGTLSAQIKAQNIYSRIVLDKSSILQYSTFPLPVDDMVPDNRNYHYCFGYSIQQSITFYNKLSSTPTEWGLYQPGQYYERPSGLLLPKYFPVGRSAWDELSIWFSFSANDKVIEESGRAEYTLKDAFDLSSVISVLLGQIAPNVKHEATTDYSHFLYGSFDPIVNAAFRLFITQKSNILSGDYDRPAQKAPATLRMIMDMLRDCFRLYWFIDRAENNDLRFRIEHIHYFMNGGSYSEEPSIGTDLTAMQVSRNGKPWAFDTSKYSYDKLTMPERYQFRWADDVTDSFDGFPISIESKFVQAGNIEEISITNFTSDVDYMLLNPASCDESGFALLAPESVDDKTQFAKLDNAGLQVYSPLHFITPYIAVNPGDTVEWDTGGNVDGYLCEYTYNGLFVNYWVPQVGGRTITVGSCAYIRATFDANGRFGYVKVNGTKVYPGPGYKVFKLPYVDFNSGGLTYRIVQNAYVAFYWLQQYYMYDMPAFNIDADFYNNSGTAEYIKKQKTQELQYPAYSEPNLYQLVKTFIGNGQIEKLSINLSSRKAKVTLRYDTE